MLFQIDVKKFGVFGELFPDGADLVGTVLLKIQLIHHGGDLPFDGAGGEFLLGDKFVQLLYKVEFDGKGAFASRREHLFVAEKLCAGGTSFDEPVHEPCGAVGRVFDEQAGVVF